MDLKEKFKTIKPRENAGSMASNRFDFQKNWAVCKLIELAKSNSDFVLAFEYHEDIIILDSSENPKIIDFFQIKTKNKGKFSLNELLKRSKISEGEGNSILGKLASNKINFTDNARSLNIVSNADYNLSANQKDNIYFCCNEIPEEDKLKIIQQLKLELGSHWVNDILDTLFFHSSELTIDHHNEITKDKLNRFIETLYSSDVKYNPSLAYRTIFDEVNRRNNIEKSINNFEELVKYKAISKKDFAEMLDTVVVEPNKLDNLKNKIFNSLDLAGVTILFRRNLVNAWKDVEVNYFNVDNDFFIQCTEIISKIIAKNSEKLDVNILESLEIIYSDTILNPKIKNQKIYSEFFLKAVILKMLYDEK